MAIFDWALRHGIDKRPGPSNFWSLRDHDIPARPGVYVLVAGPGGRFNYPAGRSPVFYIGCSKNLRQRLIDHLKWSEEAADYRRSRLYWPRYEYAAVYGSRYAYIRTWQNVTPKQLEDILLACFALRYLSFPVANGQGAWRRVQTEIEHF